MDSHSAELARRKTESGNFCLCGLSGMPEPFRLWWECPWISAISTKANYSMSEEYVMVSSKLFRRNSVSKWWKMSMWDLRTKKKNHEDGEKVLYKLHYLWNNLKVFLCNSSHELDTSEFSQPCLFSKNVEGLYSEFVKGKPQSKRTSLHSFLPFFLLEGGRVGQGGVSVRAHSREKIIPKKSMNTTLHHCGRRKKKITLNLVGNQMIQKSLR